MRTDAVAIVPAGGAARRLGPIAAAGKAALSMSGRTFLERVCTMLVGEVSRVIVVAGAGALPAVGVPVEVIHDAQPGAGPLSAVRDGLAHARSGRPPPRLAVLCACDVPLVAPAVIRLLLAQADRPQVRWVLPVVGGHPQPLLSLLAVDLLPEIEAALATGRGSLRDLAAEIGRTSLGAVRELSSAELQAADPTLDSFLDVDTPADLARVSARAAADPDRA